MGQAGTALVAGSVQGRRSRHIHEGVKLGTKKTERSGSTKT